MPKRSDEMVCERCEEHTARCWLSLPNSNGVLLAREAICEGCARDVGLDSGTVMGGHKAIEKKP